jgi:hypothetical protein
MLQDVRREEIIKVGNRLKTWRDERVDDVTED